MVGSKYCFNHTSVYLLGTDLEDAYLRIVTTRARRLSGFDDESPVEPSTVRKGVNEVKLANNVSRAKRTIYEYAICNDWDFFFTGTLDPSRYDRTNLDKYRKDLTQYIRNVRRLHGADIKYVLIPELHKDGKSWHMHGFVSGIPKKHLKRFELGDTMSSYLARKVANGDEIYNWLGYAERFGFCDLEPIKDRHRASKYITKYITKDLAFCVQDVGRCMYFASKGLQKANKLLFGILGEEISYDFQNDYCSIATLPYSDDLLQYLTESISSPLKDFS